jgi:hypothetical protein
MEPVSAITGVLSIAKAAGDVSKKLYQLSKTLKDRDLKAQIHEVVDELHELKQAASELEDQNRELREKLRFKSDEYEFLNPFWYDRNYPDRPLCPKCFSKQIAGPMSSAKHTGVAGKYIRHCLVCGEDQFTEFSQERDPVHK